MRPLSEQTILVTGATDGIGEEIARDLAGRGATVLLHGRDPERVRAAGERLGGPGAWEPAVADLGSFADVRALAADVASRHARLDAIVNNAGIGFGTAPREGARTQDGHEPTWQVNFLSHFLLTLALRGPLAAAGGARVVNMSSGVSSSGEVDLDRPDDPRGTSPYTQSKIALILFAFELADRWREDAVAANACSPGWIATKMGGAGGRPLADGADTALWLLSDPALDGTTGAYFADRREQRPNPQSLDAGARARLWDLAERQTGAAA